MGKKYIVLSLRIFQTVLAPGQMDKNRLQIYSNWEARKKNSSTTGLCKVKPQKRKDFIPCTFFFAAALVHFIANYISMHFYDE